MHGVNRTSLVTRENIHFLITYEKNYNITLKDTNILYLFLPAFHTNMDLNGLAWKYTSLMRNKIRIVIY